MTIQSKQAERSRLSGLWRKRATYTPGKTRRHREKQLRDQITLLWATVLISLIGGLLFVYLNWMQAGSAKAVSCEEYPQFCVPLVGGGTLDHDRTPPESDESRSLDGETVIPEKVVRGITNTWNMPFIGDPNAPIHFVVLEDFACSHCQEFHRNDLERFIKDYVLTGKATVQTDLLTGTGRSFSETATQAALCAGEQGAFWEMSDELFRLGSAMSYTNAFSASQILQSADDMGLDQDAMRRCINSGVYRPAITEYRIFAQDNGVTGTPTVLVSYGNDQWLPVPSRSYESLRSLTDKAWANLQPSEQSEPAATEEAAAATEEAE